MFKPSQHGYPLPVNSLHFFLIFSIVLEAQHRVISCIHDICLYPCNTLIMCIAHEHLTLNNFLMYCALIFDWCLWQRELKMERNSYYNEKM